MSRLTDDKSRAQHPYLFAYLDYIEANKNDTYKLAELCRHLVSALKENDLKDIIEFVGLDIKVQESASLTEAVNKKYLNGDDFEKQLPTEMRYKYFTEYKDADDVYHFTWVTQEPFDAAGQATFKKNIKEIADRVFDECPECTAVHAQLCLRDFYTGSLQDGNTFTFNRPDIASVTFSEQDFEL